MRNAFLLLMIAAPLTAQTLSGFIDGYYAANRNHPDPRLNFFPGTGTTAHRADQLALNIAAVSIARNPKPFGFHVTLVAGDSADVVHAGEPDRHRHPIRNLYQASLSYNVPVGRGLLLEGGVYPSHIGFEGFFTKDNWSYTRGWLGELSPYYQSGIKASYAWSDRGSAQVHLLNGWQNISDRSAPTAIGTQVSYDGTRLSTSLNTYADAHRKFGDYIATYKATPKLSLGTSIDRGHQTPANWLGLAAFIRYSFDDRHAIAARAERFCDPRAGISGLSQTLNEGTLTFEYRPSSHVIFKVEGRRDHSTAPVFDNNWNQTLAIASAVALF